MQVEGAGMMQGTQVEGGCRGGIKRHEIADFSRFYSAIGYIY